ncbi:unnamed protein product [Brachionus calyciflorus]|uniref:Tudor domain-containing protein n=1 Tax=Brachionus calyciflorus TaxID=104777 RepID=A0A813M213_9BILA|nr:unnamed protein product [Brachionus calyciflorus]
MEVDSESTLQEYQIQLEQVEIALRSQPDSEELLRLKSDLEEVIKLTQDLIAEEADEDKAKSKTNINWKAGDKCMAVWRVDGKYYSATIKQILEDGSCTVVFEGQSNIELTQVGQLMPRSKNPNILSNDYLTQKPSSKITGNKKAFSKKELELKLREAKKRKREKFAAKLKAMDEISEKEKNKWKNFNTKLASKTWKGVVKKSKFEIPSDHENKIGVGTNSLLNRPVSASGTILPTNTNSSAQAAANSIATTTNKPRYSAQSYRTSTYH